MDHGAADLGAGEARIHDGSPRLVLQYGDEWAVPFPPVGVDVERGGALALDGAYEDEEFLVIVVSDEQRAGAEDLLRKAAVRPISPARFVVPSVPS